MLFIHPEENRISFFVHQLSLAIPHLHSFGFAVLTVISIGGSLCQTHYPDLEKLVQLADYFQVSTDYLLGRREYTKTARAAQTCHSQDETLTKIIHGLLQLPEDRRQALALIIGDMEQRAAAPNEGGSK